MQQEEAPPPAPAEGDGPRLPRSIQVPGFVLTAILVLAFLLHLPRGTVMYEWSISAQIIAAGYWENVFLHMFAHAGWLHLAMNSAVLVAVSPMVVLRLGAPLGSWLRYGMLFVSCGLAGLAMFLALHPEGEVPMLGASGAIYGLVGFLVRYPGATVRPAPLLSPETARATVDFIKVNFVLILLLTVPALLSGQGGGVAWEGHLGGFLFGMLVAPVIAPSDPRWIRS